jgi:tetratricopeptide (TPR) repeat protein
MKKYFLLTGLFLFPFLFTEAQKTNSRYHTVDSLIKLESSIDAMIALQELEDNFKKDTLKAQYWIRHSKASFLFSNPLQAMKSIDKAIALDKNNVEAYYEKGRLCNDRNELENSRDAFSKAIAIDPQGQYYYWRGIIYQQLKRNDLAEYDYKIAISKSFKSPELYNNYAIILAEKEKFREAMLLVSKSIALDKSYLQSYATRAKLHVSLLNIDSACIDQDYAYRHGYNGILTVPEEICNGTQLLKLQYAAEALAQNEKYKLAIDVYTKLMVLNSDSSNYYVNRGYCYFMTKEYEKSEKDYLRAEEDYRKAIMVPNESRKLLYHNFSALYFEMDKYEKAVEYNNKNIEMDPANAIAHLDRGLCCRKLKWYAEAEKEFNYLIAANPNFNRAYGYRSFLYFELGKYAKAKEDAERSVTLNPEYGYGYIVLGQVKMKLGETDYCEDFKKAKKYGNEDAEEALKSFCK